MTGGESPVNLLAVQLRAVVRRDAQAARHEQVDAVGGHLGARHGRLLAQLDRGIHVDVLEHAVQTTNEWLLDVAHGTTSDRTGARQRDAIIGMATGIFAMTTVSFVSGFHSFTTPARSVITGL